MDDIGSRPRFRGLGKPGNLRGRFGLTVPKPNQAVSFAYRKHRRIEAPRYRLGLSIGGNQHASAGGIKTQPVKRAFNAPVADTSKTQLRRAMRTAVFHAHNPPARVASQNQPLVEPSDTDRSANLQLHAVQDGVPLLGNEIVPGHSSALETLPPLGNTPRIAIATPRRISSRTISALVSSFIRYAVIHVKQTL